MLFILIISRNPRLLSIKEKSKEDLKDPEIRRKVLTDTLELLFVIKEKKERMFENYLKVESFRRNVFKLYEKFGYEIFKNSDIVIDQFINVFKNFAGLQQKINQVVELLKKHK